MQQTSAFSGFWFDSTAIDTVQIQYQIYFNIAVKVLVNRKMKSISIKQIAPYFCNKERFFFFLANGSVVIEYEDT